MRKLCIVCTFPYKTEQHQVDFTNSFIKLFPLDEHAANTFFPLKIKLFAIVFRRHAGRISLIVATLVCSPVLAHLSHEQGMNVVLTSKLRP